jgi:hypothetical protein
MSQNNANKKESIQIVKEGKYLRGVRVLLHTEEMTANITAE